MINSTLFLKINFEFMYIICTLRDLQKKKLVFTLLHSNANRALPEKYYCAFLLPSSHKPYRL
jgi:hypothetical protein